MGPQYIDVQVSGHDSFEDENLCTAVSAYSGPHMQFQGMFWLWFSFRRFANFPITSTVELFEGDRAMMSKVSPVSKHGGHKTTQNRSGSPFIVISGLPR